MDVLPPTFPTAGMAPSFLIFSTGRGVRTSSPCLPHCLSLTSNEACLILMKSVKNASCLKAAFSLYLMTAWASEWQLECGRSPRGSQTGHGSLRAGFSSISWLGTLLCTCARAVSRPSEGGKAIFQFPNGLLPSRSCWGNWQQPCKGDKQSPRVRRCCMSERARALVFSRLCPISGSQSIVYVKVKQQQTK